MNIGLIGYGKMGREIEKIALSRGHQISAKISSPDELSSLLPSTDVAIDFSVPDAAISNLKWSIDNGIPIVIGTTGWYNQFDEVVKYCEAANGAMFHATNFSVGVNILFKLNEDLATMMSKLNQYNAHIDEVHHIHKLDSPSGTAISLAEGLIENHGAYQQWEEQQILNSKKGLLPILAHREDEVPGIHVVTYDSGIDSISIKHSAKSRIGFAQGSVLAAEFLQDRTGVFNMKHLLNFN